MNDFHVTIPEEIMLRSLGYLDTNSDRIADQLAESSAPEPATQTLPTTHEPDQQTAAAIRQAIKKTEQTIRPRFISRVLKREELALPGEDIQQHLGKAEFVVILAATLGNEIDFAIRQAQQLDMTEAVLLDRAASLAIEEYLDLIENNLRNDYRQEGFYLTTRFSPGYGDLPLETGKRLLDLLDARRKIGLTVNQGGLMTPIKSVSCIMGVGAWNSGSNSSDTDGSATENPGIPPDPCAICQRNKTCALRQKGGYCGRYRKSTSK